VILLSSNKEASDDIWASMHLDAFSLLELREVVNELRVIGPTVREPGACDKSREFSPSSRVRVVRGSYCNPNHLPAIPRRNAPQTCKCAIVNCTRASRGCRENR